MIRACVIPLLIVMSGQAAAQEKPTPEQIKAMMEKMRPGPEHKQLAGLEGRWTQEITYDMGGGKPAKARGTTTNRMVLGGRFLISENSAKASFGMADMNHDVMRIYGFDRRTNEYTVIELDTMGTYWVQSGFGSGAEWDDEFHMTEGGWSYFLEHLRWYLEKHPGIPRDLISFRERTSLSRQDALRRLLGPAGLSSDDTLQSAPAGRRFRSTTAAGDPISGIVLVASPATGQFGLTLSEPGEAILFLEMEPASSGCRAGFWLSTYGLHIDTVSEVRECYARLYRGALERVPQT